ncbi:MAG: ParA family protein [Deltaproteobacteria bacterium]|nr:ParA family protein [Deltaproteobacteria bacterium]
MGKNASGAKNGVVICLANNKGGIGKTSVACNLGCALARKNKRVLVVDNDPQCNASGILLPKRVLVHSTLYEIYSPNGGARRVEACVYPTDYPRLSCLPNVEETSGLHLDLASDYPDTLRVLERRIRNYAKKTFDVTLIDCPPTVCLFTANALFASDYVVVPVDAGSAHSLDGLKKVMDLIAGVQEAGNSGLKLLRLLVNRVDARTSISKTIIAEVEKRFGEEGVFFTRIPDSTVFERAEYAKETVFSSSPSSKAAKVYEALADELLEILKGEASP